MRASKGRMARLLLVSMVATLALASIGFATRELNPASSAAKVTPDSASFQAVMVKLERLEAEIRKSAQITEELRKTIATERRQNAQHFGLLASSSIRPGMLAAPASPAPPKIVPTRLKLAIELCAKKNRAFAGKVAPKLSGEGDLQGLLGVDIFGSGGKAKLETKFGAELGTEFSAESGLELTACLSGVEVDITSADVPNFDALVNGMVGGWPQTAADISDVFIDAPLMHTAQLSTTLNAMDTFQLAIGPARAISTLQNPSLAFQDVQGLVDTLPLPGNLNSVIRDPSALFPNAGDLNVSTLCSGAAAGSLLGDTCFKIQNFQNPLDPLASKLDAAEVKIATLQTGVTGFCNNVNNRLTTIRNGSIPARNFSLNLGPVGTFNIPVDVVRTPFSSLTTVSCPVF